MNIKRTENTMLKNRHYSTLHHFKVLPFLTLSKVTTILHNLMPDKDHKEGALKA